MAEPSTGALAVTAAVGMTTASLIPGIDVNAVVGAFAGAMFFVVFAGELTPCRASVTSLPLGCWAITCRAR